MLKNTDTYTEINRITREAIANKELDLEEYRIY